MTDLPKCVLPECGRDPIARSIDNTVRCSDPTDCCPQSYGYYTEDEWRLLNDPGPQLSERTREREELAREIWSRQNFSPKNSFTVAERFLKERDEWRAKDGNDEG